MDDGYTMLSGEGITLWIPEEMRFADDLVRVEQTGFLWSSNIEVMTALGIQRGAC
ncbi:MAG: hypothetical protein WC948_00180 [Thermovirgaceae bacterium]